MAANNYIGYWLLLKSAKSQFFVSIYLFFKFIIFKKLYNNSQEKYLKLMHTVNPLVIPRNHKVEEVLMAANDGNISPMKNLNKILEKPYIYQENIIHYQFPNSDTKEKYQTFCGT